MKRFRLAVVISLLCLTTFAVPAAAECAWVLWSIPQGVPKGSGPWEPLSGTKAYEECQQYAQANAKRNPETFYTCLPDTVDPRGPRGKG